MQRCWMSLGEGSGSETGSQEELMEQVIKVLTKQRGDELSNSATLLMNLLDHGVPPVTYT